MTQEGQIPPPPVLWAQRKDILYVTICLEDCKQKELTIEPEMIHFKGVGGTEKKMHEVTINLYAEIDTTKTVENHADRTIELVLTKQKPGPYWPRLTKDKVKVHWLKSDFNKWKDEDDSDGEMLNNSHDIEQMMKAMSNVSGSNSSKPEFDDLNDAKESDDSDDGDDDMLPWLY